MSKRFPVPILLAPALLLAGCTGTFNPGLESVHQPVVNRTDYVFDVPTQGGTMTESDAERLAGWMESMRLGYGDRVAIDDGGMNGRMREQIAAMASHYGLIVADNVPVTAGQLPPGTVRVVVTRTAAAVPNCPDNSRIIVPDYSQSTTSNFGCAINSNLAAMVADPADLVRGQPGSGTADPATATKAVSTFRRAQPTGAGGTQIKSESTGGSSK